MATKNQLKMLDIMFDKDDFTGTSSDSQRWSRCGFLPDLYLHELICINAIDPECDHNPTREYHSPDKPRVSNANVIKHRSFLLEFDNGSISEQIRLMEETYRIPYSAAIFSGGKSVHFLISLEEPISKVKYEAIAKSMLPSPRELERRKIQGLWLGVQEADTACKNACRSIRMPDVRRAATGKMQEILYIGQRIQLVNLLESIEIIPEPVYTTGEFRPSDEWIQKKVNDKLAELKATQKGGRHLMMTEVVWFIKKCDIDIDTCFSLVRANTDLPTHEIQNTIRATY